MQFQKRTENCNSIKKIRQNKCIETQTKMTEIIENRRINMQRECDPHFRLNQSNTSLSGKSFSSGKNKGRLKMKRVSQIMFIIFLFGWYFIVAAFAMFVCTFLPIFIFICKRTHLLLRSSVFAFCIALPFGIFIVIVVVGGTAITIIILAFVIHKNSLAFHIFAC